MKFSKFILVFIFFFIFIKTYSQLIISEVADTKDNTNARFVELYNTSAIDIDFSEIDYYLVRQSGGAGFSRTKIDNNILASGETYVIAKNDDEFFSAYGFHPDETASNVPTGNGDDMYAIYKNGNETNGELIDIYGVIDTDGTGENWEYTDSKAVRNSNIFSPNNTWTFSEWTITNDQNISDMSPGVHNENIPQILISESLQNFGNVISNQKSSPQFYKIIGKNLIQNITISPPEHFKISLDNVDYTNSNIILNQVDGNVELTTIYVKFCPTNIGEKSGNIIVTSENANNRNIFVMGNSVDLPLNLETFENYNHDESYLTSDFIGNNNITWNYVMSKNAFGNFEIDAEGLVMKTNSENSACFSGTISGGIANFSVQFRKAHIGTGERQIEVFINDISKGMSQILNDDENLGIIENFEIENINIEGDFTIKIKNIKEDQVTIDNISWTNYPPEAKISLYGNNQNIEYNSNEISTENNTNFGEINVLNENVIKEFTIKNVGNENLILQETPILIGGASSDNFQITSLPSLTIAPNESSNFSLKFDPIDVGTTVAKVEIFSSDSEKNPYIFYIKGKSLGNNSSSSDIISLGNEEETISYKEKISENINSINDAQKVFSFQIREGGENGDDDNFSTFLNSLIIEKAENNSLENWKNTIKKAALFHNENKILETEVLEEKIIFANCNLEILDDANKNFDLYLTFETENIIDNQFFQFKISEENICTNAENSAFGNFNISSEINKNKIVVIAEKIVFSNLYPEDEIYTNLSFEVEVFAYDNFNNLDLDANNSLILSKNSGSGNLSSEIGLTQNLQNGTFKWNDVKIDEQGILKLQITDNQGILNSQISREITVNFISVSIERNDLIFTEINSHQNPGATYVEIYNNTSSEISLDNLIFEHYNNGAASTTAVVNLSGNLASDEFIIITKIIDDFYENYPEITPNYILSSLFLNGGKDRLVLKKSDGTIIDLFNIDGENAEDMSDNHLYYRKGFDNEGSNLSENWLIMGENQMGSPLEKNDFFWKGEVSSDFHNENNWYEKRVPENVSLIILNAPNSPEISGNVICKNLLIKENMSLTIKENAYLTVNGILENQSGISGLKLKSSVTGDAGLLQNNSNILADVDKYLSSERWHFISSPLVSTVVLTDIFNSEIDVYANLYNPETANWDNMTIGNSLNLDKLNACSVWTTENHIANFQGVLNNGEQSISVKKNSDNEGWNLIGNPYTSAINWDLVNLSASNLNNAIYFWNGINYSSYVSGAGTNGGVNIIPSMQGFFVQCNNDEDGILSFENSYKLSSAQNNFKKNGKKEEKNFLRIFAKNKDFTDEIIVRFMENAISNFDKEFDARKKFNENNNEIPQIFTKSKDDEKLVINSLPFFEKKVTVETSVLIENFENFELNFQKINFEKDIFIYLENLQNNEILDIEKINNYKINKISDKKEYKFLLHFLKKNDEIQEKDFLIYSYKNKIYIKNNFKKGINVELEIFDILGKSVLKKSIKNLYFEEFTLQKKGIFFCKLKYSLENSEKEIIEKIKIFY